MSTGAAALAQAQGNDSVRQKDKAEDDDVVIDRRLETETADVGEAHESYIDRTNDYWSLPDGVRGEAERLSLDIFASEQALATRNHANSVAAEVAMDGVDTDLAPYGEAGGDTLRQRFDDDLADRTREIWSDHDVYGFAHAASDEIEQAQTASPGPEPSGSSGQDAPEGGSSVFAVPTEVIAGLTAEIDAAVDELQVAMGAVGGAEEIPHAIGRTAERAADQTNAQQLEVTNLLATTFYDMTITCMRIGTAMTGVAQGIQTEVENYEAADQSVADVFSA